MEPKQKTFLHFIRVTNTQKVPEEILLNANLIEQIKGVEPDFYPPDYFLHGANSVIWMTGDSEESGGVHVRETVHEILEQIYAIWQDKATLAGRDNNKE